MRVRTAAVHALGHVRSAAATEALVETLREPFEPNLFPALVDAGARTNDLRIVEPALAGLKRLRVPVVRLQVINGICRLLGEKNHFYRIATANKLQRAALRAAMIARIRRLLRTADLHECEAYPELMATVSEATAALAADRDEDFAEHCRHLAGLIRSVDDVPEISERAAYAIETYLEDAPSNLLSSEGVVFLIVCLTSLARHLPRARRP